jgi:hypothetical protein
MTMQGDLPTLKEFSNWLNASPRTGRYHYENASSCPLAEYGKDHNYKLYWSVVPEPFVSLINTEYPEMDTYEELAIRVRKAIEDEG